MKKISLFILLMSCILCFSACSTKQSNTFEYSNMFDYSTREQVANLLLDSNVDKNNAELFFKFVEDFYKVSYEGIANEGFLKRPISELTYETYTIDSSIKHWDELGFTQSDNDINCRIAAFVLVQQVILSSTIESPSEIIDKELIDSHYLLDFSESEKNKYGLLFNDIRVGVDTDKKEAVNAINDTLRQRGITFNNNLPIRLISFYLQENNSNLIKVIHAAVLMEIDSKKYLIEKYNPKEPYQVSIFNEYDDIVIYLNQRLNKAKLKSASNVIIMNNSDCIN